YGEFVTDYIKNGADFIFVITNDGWWGNTAGYKQHLNYSQLRAIETRRSIARSANTGISAFINQRGEILSRTQWWVRDAIKDTIKANTELTFYVKYGDYIGRLAGFLAIFIFLYAFVQSILNKSVLKKKK
ncbi:MAG: apolipoprotein N-acyltransferase, partial [Bacteroidales bacterium]|nr:apolipoprotein N-acyltransferase [Bacteroidales bacterium]